MHVAGCLLQVKQGYFYLRNEENVDELLAIDPSPLSFEIGADPIPITIKYGLQHFQLLVDAQCHIQDIKARCNQVDGFAVVHSRF